MPGLWWLVPGYQGGVARSSAHRPGLHGPQLLCSEYPDSWRLVTRPEGSRVLNPSFQLHPSCWPRGLLARGDWEKAKGVVIGRKQKGDEKRVGNETAQETGSDGPGALD